MEESYEPVFNEYIEYEHDISQTGRFPNKIETDSFILQPLMAFKDISRRELFEVYESNKETDKYLNTRVGLPTDYNEFCNFLSRLEDTAGNGQEFFYSMYTKDKTFIGQTTIEDVDWDLKRCSIGVWLRKEYWGNGYSQKRAEAVLYTIFDDLELEIVEITAIPENTNCIKSIEKYLSKLGGQFNGIQRRATVTPSGEPHDLAMYSITKEEFFSDSQTHNLSDIIDES